jgi:hypothetical protein
MTLEFLEFERLLRTLEATLGFYTLSGAFAVIERPQFAKFVEMLEVSESPLFPSWSLVLGDTAPLAFEDLQSELNSMAALKMLNGFEVYLQATQHDLERSSSIQSRLSGDVRKAVWSGSDSLEKFIQQAGPSFHLPAGTASIYTSMLRVVADSETSEEQVEDEAPPWMDYLATMHSLADAIRSSVWDPHSASAARTV